MTGTTMLVLESIIAAIVGLGGIIATITYFYARYKGSKDKAKTDNSTEAISTLQSTVEALKTQNALQAGQITNLNNDRKDLAKEVGVLTGKVETLSTIPLEKIEQHMSATNKILESLLPLLPGKVEHTVIDKTTASK